LCDSIIVEIKCINVRHNTTDVLRRTFKHLTYTIIKANGNNKKKEQATASIRFRMNQEIITRRFYRLYFNVLLATGYHNIYMF
jgi:hypothetical protein